MTFKVFYVLQKMKDATRPFSNGHIFEQAIINEFLSVLLKFSVNTLDYIGKLDQLWEKS